MVLELGLVWLEKKSWTLKDYLLLVNKDASLIAIEKLKTSLLKSSNGFSEWKIIEWFENLSLHEKYILVHIVKLWLLAIQENHDTLYLALNMCWKIKYITCKME